MFDHNVIRYTIRYLKFWKWSSYKRKTSTFSKLFISGRRCYFDICIFIVIFLHLWMLIFKIEQTWNTLHMVLHAVKFHTIQNFNFITVWVFTQAFSIFFLYIPDVLLSAVSSLTMWRKFYYIWSVSVIRLYVLSISSTAIVSLILYFQVSISSLLVFSLL